jgi:hypothetical protein
MMIELTEEETDLGEIRPRGENKTVSLEKLAATNGMGGNATECRTYAKWIFEFK